MMGRAYDKLREARDNNNREKFAERSARARLTVTEVSEDKRQAWGSEDGAGRFPILSFGATALEPGEVIVAEREGGNVANPAYRYVSHLDSDAPAPGLLRREPGPPPEFATVWNTQRLDSLNGATFVRITIYFQIDPSLGPSKVYLSHKPSTVPDWTDQVVPFVQSPGIQSAEISIPYASGINVDVQMRAEYQYSYAPSVPSETRVVTTGSDTGSPGVATDILVDTTTAGMLRLEAVGTIDPSRFVGWRYEIATAPGGPATYAVVVNGPYLHTVQAGGTFYVAVAPVSRANVLGTRFPGTTTFEGPYTVTPNASVPDLTAPPVWGAPILTGDDGQVPPNGDWTAYLFVDFPAGYAFPADYAATVIRIWDGFAFSEDIIPYRGDYPTEKFYTLPFGTYEVWLYGIDRSDNKGALSPSASVTINNPGVPANATAPTTEQMGLAVAVLFSMPSLSQTVEIQRATSAIGAGAATIWQGVGTRYLDLHTELTTFPTNYWYRYRGRNFAGDGGWSVWVQGTINRLDGTVISANTINGDRIIANTLDANTIKTNTILSALIKTANTGKRWELEGATGGANQMQFRTYEAVLGVDKLRSLYDGTQMVMYNDSAIARMVLNKSGLALYRDGGNLRAYMGDFGMNVYNDSAVIRSQLNSAGLDMYNSAGTWRGRMGSGGLLMYSDAGSPNLRIALLAGAQDSYGATMQLNTTDTGFSVYNNNYGAGWGTHAAAWGGIYVPVIQSTGGYGLTFGNAGPYAGFAEDYIRIYNDGRLTFGRPSTWPDAGIALWANPFGAYGLKTTANDKATLTDFQARDIFSQRATTIQGIIWLGDRSAGDRYVFWNGSNYVMPGGNILATGFTVTPSSRASKRNIREMKIDRTKMRALRPSMFKFNDDPDDMPDRFGFIAEDVEAAIPGMGIDLSGKEGPDGKPGSGMGYALEGMVAAQQAMIVELADELDALRAEVEAIRKK